MSAFETLKEMLTQVEGGVGISQELTVKVDEFLNSKNYAFYYIMNLKFRFRKYCRDHDLPQIDISISDQNKYKRMKKDVVDNRRDFNVSKMDILKLKELSNPDPKDPNYVKKVFCYLMYVSGRRIGEIHRGGFTVNSGKLWYTPLKKGKEAGRESFELIEGVGIDVPRFMELYDTIKDNIQSQKPNTIVQSINRFIKNVLGDEYKTHRLRGIYGSIMGKSKEGSPSNNIQNALNHSDGNSVKHYDYIKVSLPDKDDVFCNVCKKTLKKRSFKKHQTTKLHLKLKGVSK